MGDDELKADLNEGGEKCNDSQDQEVLGNTAYLVRDAFSKFFLLYTWSFARCKLGNDLSEKDCEEWHQRAMNNGGDESDGH